MINTRRLQVKLVEMGHRKQEIFKKEYADMSWYKGKQTKHMMEMEMGQKRPRLSESCIFYPNTCGV
jgi:5'-3' exoribonuclease 1